MSSAVVRYQESFGQRLNEDADAGAWESSGALRLELDGAWSLLSSRSSHSALILECSPNSLRGDPSSITLAMVLLPSFSGPLSWA